MERFPFNAEANQMRYKEIMEQYQNAQATYSQPLMEDENEEEQEVEDYEPRSMAANHNMNMRETAMDAGAGDYSSLSSNYRNLPLIFERQPYNSGEASTTGDATTTSEDEEFVGDPVAVGDVPASCAANKQLQASARQHSVFSGTQPKQLYQKAHTEAYPNADGGLDINYLMLLGLMLGMLMGKGLRYMQYYFAGCQLKVHQMRVRACGDLGLVALMQKNDVSQPLVYKLILVPVYLVCSFLAATLFALNFCTGLLLANVPKSWLNFFCGWTK